jgi:hypothetical protein
MANQIAFRTCSQQYINSRGVNRGARGPDPLHCDRQIVERLLPVSGRVLYRETGDTRIDAQPHVGRYTIGIVRVSGFKIGVDRQVHCGDHLRDVRQYHVSWDRRVGQSAGKSKSCAGGGQRRKTEVPQVPRRAYIPRVRDNEAARFVKFDELGTARPEVDQRHTEESHETGGTSRLTAYDAIQ